MSAKQHPQIQNSEAILTVGLQYVNHRGGIGGVIETYSNYFSTFNFVSSYKPQKNKILIIPYFLLSCLRLIWMLSTRTAIKIVHIHGAAKGSLMRKYILFYLSKYLFGKKVIYHSHGSELAVFYNVSRPIIRNRIKFLFEHVDEIICLSKQWADFFQLNFKIKKLVILENIVEEQQLSLKERSHSWPIMFLFLGAIGKRKGIFDLLDGIAAHKDELLGKCILTIGGNGEEQKLKEFIEKNGLSQIVDFKGWVTGMQKAALLAACDVYILPSYNEGLPLSILEAMSYGKAIISTNVGGIPEVVKDNVNGYVINPGDKQAIVNSLLKFISQPELLKEMGNASIEIVHPYYSKNVIEKLNLIYKDLLQS